MCVLFTYRSCFRPTRRSVHLASLKSHGSLRHRCQSLAHDVTSAVKVTSHWLVDGGRRLSVAVSNSSINVRQVAPYVCCLALVVVVAMVIRYAWQRVVAGIFPPHSDQWPIAFAPADWTGRRRIIQWNDDSFIYLPGVILIHFLHIAKPVIDHCLVVGNRRWEEFGIGFI